MKPAITASLPYPLRRYHESALEQKEQRIKLLEQHIQRVSARQVRLQQLSDRYVRLRLTVFIVGALLSSITFLLAGPVYFWVPFIAFAAVFIVLVTAHRRVLGGIRNAGVWLQHQTAQVARARLDWSHIPPSEVADADKQHPFALDLDLLGEQSLHQLLNTSTTAEGAERLASWLTNTRPDAGDIAKRQSLIRELIPLAHFRDGLVRHGMDTTDGDPLPWRTSELMSHLATNRKGSSLKPSLIISAVLSALTLTLFVLNVREGIAPIWAVTWALYVLLFVSNVSQVHELFEKTLAAHTSLRRLQAVFRFLEHWSYPNTPNLRTLCGPFLDHAHSPSRLLNKLTAILGAASLQQNLFLWLPVNLLIPWDLFFAYQLRQSEAQLSLQLPAWLDTWHELEALCSLANYGYLNPAATLPVLVNGPSTAAPFSAKTLGHPLIPDTSRVCNDFALQDIGDIALVTGSNMSGKSSFLRTLGVSLVMAYAGGPVCAQHLETRLFRLYTCITVSDSLVDGISYFYAEVKRLKHLLDALQTKDSQPLFFLIDEIFKGTNNRERLIGSRSYVQALAGHDGLGVISTHDLELTKLENEIPQLTNYHFREHVDGNQLIFDYVLRRGPSPSTNALLIMKREGLPVVV